MPQNKQKLICNTLTMVVVATVAIVLFGFSSSYSSVAALSLQLVIHHPRKVFDNKQQDSASSGGDGSSSNTKSSDNSNNDGSSDGNNNSKNQGTNDGSSNSDAHDNLQSVEPAKTGKEWELGSGENVASPTRTTAPTPQSQTSCEQGSNCTDQQGVGDHDRSSTTGSASKSGQDNNTPFILPFP